MEGAHKKFEENLINNKWVRPYNESGSSPQTPCENCKKKLPYIVKWGEGKACE